MHHEMLEYMVALGVGKKRKNESEETLLDNTPKKTSNSISTRDIVSIPVVNHQEEKRLQAPHGSLGKYKF